ncbi:arylsulfatase [Pseudomonas schmalbachii]|uniref:Arylsulfatase n=1 Tax=Pseudomonas schmalbachii TaxID=2816993 RepID=A0ABS3TS01_9PSED|nr:arylsulfatase [Pseudomonas schmalbachii]MBO3276444.1 arylsulfatase [Pseudomonas schmalbachii]
MTRAGKWLSGLTLAASMLGSAASALAADKPNILVIFGDDIGMFNVSAYNQGMMGYETPNIDRIAREGALFTHAYGEQSCTAGRSAFILGEHPFRTGLLTVGMPGSEHGIPDWAPTLGDVMKQQGYTTGQFGKNHLGDRDKHLPTNHGFDEFFGNLYHMNAEEEPETYYYPKDPEFRKKYGPRGVIHSYADGRIEDTGPLTRKRMETIDDELVQATENFIDKAHKADKPFFVWFNSTRMHIWTHLKKEYDGKSGIGLYPDGMLEHDDHVGKLLKKLDDLGIADNTIIVYTTDNGAQKFSWPDGGTSPFNGEKGTSNEGGHRVPLLVKWPGVIKPGSRYNNLIAHNDWMPTLAAAAGNPNLVAEMAKGTTANGKQWRVHLDGYNFLPFFKGEAKDSPREEYIYFSMGGDLDAIRWKDWRLAFATMDGDFGSAVRKVANVPVLTNLKADPFQTARQESDMARRWAADQAWLLVPIQAKVKGFLATLSQYPFQEGVSLNVAGINYQSLKVKKAMMELEQQKKPASN